MEIFIMDDSHYWEMIMDFPKKTRFPMANGPKTRNLGLFVPWNIFP
jgi:hypothetical protein